MHAFPPLCGYNIFCVIFFCSLSPAAYLFFFFVFFVLIQCSLFRMFWPRLMRIQCRAPYGGDDGRQRIIIKKNLHTLYIFLLLLLKLINNSTNHKEPTLKLKTLKSFRRSRRIKRRARELRRGEKSLWNVSIVQQKSRISVSK